MPVIIAGKFPPKKPTYDTVLAVAQSLEKTSSPEQVSGVLKMIAEAELSVIEEATLIQKVHEATKVDKKSLRAEVKLAKQNAGLTPNDVGLAVARYVRDAHFNNGLHLLRAVDGRFMEFIGTHWVEIDKAALKHLLFLRTSDVFSGSGEQSIPALVEKAYRCLEYILGVDNTIFPDEPPCAINVKNGELWIDDDGIVELLPHNPASRMTYCLTVEYDPQATCPKYDHALFNIFSESSNAPAMLLHVNELFGYLIQPRRDIPCFWMFIGQGANGKTKLLETFQKLLGPDAALNDSISKFTQDHFNVAYLQNKLAFIDDDITDGTKLNDGLLKKISEAKTLSARRPYGNNKVTFTCRALPVMAGNNFPNVTDISDGMLRRAQIVPFDRPFLPAEQDKALFPTIWKEEMPGVLNRALEGLKRLGKRGRQFDPPEDCLKAREAFFVHANPLMGFIDACCEKVPDAKLKLMDMRNAMKAWAHEQGITKPAAADNTLKRKLEGLGHKVTKVKGYPHVWGLKLK